MESDTSNSESDSENVVQDEIHSSGSEAENDARSENVQELTNEAIREELQAELKEEKKLKSLTRTRWNMEKLLGYYDHLLLGCSPQFEDITRLFVDGNVFLVCGDSLLLSAMRNNYFFWNGGQTLHLVYLCERLLQLFQRKGAKFKLVFFDIWKHVLKKKSVVLARSVLIAHFNKSQNKRMFDVHNFSSAWDPQYCKFVKENQPSFLLLDLDLTGIFSRLSPDIHLAFVELFLSSQVLFTIALNIPCVSMEEVKMGISTIHAYVVDSCPQLQQFISRTISDLEKVAASVPKQETQCPLRLDCVPFDAGTDVRHVIVAQTAAWYLTEEGEDSFSRDLVRAFLVYGAVMEVLPLASRGCPQIRIESNQQYSQFIRKILVYMSYLLAHLTNSSYDYTQVADMWHGNLFIHILHCLRRGVSDLGVQTTNHYLKLVEEVSSISGRTLEGFPLVTGDMVLEFKIKHEEVESKEPPIGMALEKLIPTSCHLSREFCGDVLQHVYQQALKYDERIQSYITRGQTFSEVRHWHSKKPLDDSDKTRINVKKMSKKEKWWHDRKANLYARFMDLYGSSIEGRTAATKPIISKSKNKKAQKEKKTSKKALELKEVNIKRKQESLRGSEQTQLKEFMKSYKKLKVEGNYTLALEEAKKLKKRFQNKECVQKAMMYIAESCYLLWGDECRSKKMSARNVSSALELFLAVRDILTESQKSALPLGESEKRDIGKWLWHLGFGEVAVMWKLPPPEKECKDFEVGLSWVRFQLLHLGAHLERVTEGKEDQRVDFIPDPWQKKLLDIVDRRQSAVIIAPTSSGKTYASYYCMESVLREDDEGVVVYISPTKALVNQVAATIYARYKKNLPDGRSLCGVFTRDYRSNDATCQILVTVPECLDLLLMSPRQQAWVRKVRYVIFDEIHCLAGVAGGLTWESGLLMIRCPFLALSATVGNPHKLHSWLQEAEEFKQKRDKLDGCERTSYRVHLVIHSERHSDLKKYLYSESGEMIHIHPYAHMDKTVILEHGGIPKHVSLAPDEALQLNCAMEAASLGEVSMQNYRPETFFRSSSFLTRSEVRDYENCLRSLMQKWALENWEVYNLIIENLRSPLAVTENESSGLHFIHRNFLPFIQLLRKKHMFPFIFFRYDKSEISFLFSQFIKHCRSLEREPEVDDSSEDDARDSSRKSTRHSAVGSLGLLEESSAGSIRNVGQADKNDVKFIEHRLMRMGCKRDHSFPSGLRYGMGQHHAALSAKEKTAVEMLFRMKVLNAVLATGTLALGIHMPCKTVVIGGDSLYMDTLTYHQMSGRAGRRGFDNEGNVVFYGLKESRIKALLTGKFPDMIGNFPLTVSLILRLLLLTADVTEGDLVDKKAKSGAMSRALTFLNCCLVYQNCPELKEQMKHFFAFSTQLLVLQGLLDDQGKPQQLSGLITHLHYHEPGNLVLTYLLRSGALRRLCHTDDGVISKEVQLDLVVLLSRLFARLPLHPSREEMEFNNSKVFLPELPSVVRDDVKHYNEEVRFIYGHYFRCVASQLERKYGPDNKLPLSGVQFGPSAPLDSQSEGITLESTLVTQNVPRKICSNFAALSGQTDKELYSPRNVISDIRHQVFTDVKVVPLLDCSLHLNGYAWDFYNHGILPAIVKDNGIKRAQAYDLLNDFKLMLMAVKTCLDDFGIGPDDDPICCTFNIVCNNFNKKFNTAFGCYKGI